MKYEFEEEVNNVGELLNDIKRLKTESGIVYCIAHLDEIRMNCRSKICEYELRGWVVFARQ